MGGRLLKSLIFSAFLASCTPPEFESLDDVVISCDGESDSDAPPCPEDYYCETRVTPAECRPSAGRDILAPVISENIVSPQRAKAGTLLTASFTLDESLLEESLKVYLGREAFAFTLDEAASDVANHQYRLTYEVTGDEDSGTQSVWAFLKDKEGNEGTVEVGPVELDFTPPTVALSTNLPNYRDGEVVSLTVRSSETLAQAPTLEVKQDNEVITDFFTFNEAASEEGTYFYESVTVVRDAEAEPGQESAYDGSYEVSVSSFQDVLGNAGTSSPTATFDVDATMPAFSNVALYRLQEGELVEGWVFNAQATLVVCFDFEEANLQGELSVKMQDRAFVPAGEFVDYTALCTDTQYGYGINMSFLPHRC